MQRVVMRIVNNIHEYFVHWIFHISILISPSSQFIGLMSTVHLSHYSTGSLDVIINHGRRIVTAKAHAIVEITTIGFACLRSLKMWLNSPREINLSSSGSRSNSNTSTSCLNFTLEFEESRRCQNRCPWSSCFSKHHSSDSAPVSTVNQEGNFKNSDFVWDVLRFTITARWITKQQVRSFESFKFKFSNRNFIFSNVHTWIKTLVINYWLIVVWGSTAFDAMCQK